MTLWFMAVVMVFGPFGFLFINPDLEWWRRITLIVLAVITVWGLQHIIAAIQVGLGRENLSNRNIALYMAAPVAYTAVGSVDPALLPGVMLPGWLCATYVAMQFSGSRLHSWLTLSAALLVGVRLGTILLTGGAVADFGLAQSSQTWILVSVFVILAPGSAWLQVWLWELMVQVREAGDAKAELATTQERLRIAADLHDIQGHHLQVIALKAELVARQLEVDRNAARDSLNEIQSIAREALHDTRNLVQGYRAVSLHAEASNGAAILEATGAQVKVTIDDDLDHPLLATVLREATTNILRHSQADQVSIVGSSAPQSLQISNNKANPLGSGDGTGLQSLAARLAEAGGSLTWQTDDDWFTVTATLNGQERR